MAERSTRQPETGLAMRSPGPSGQGGASAELVSPGVEFEDVGRSFDGRRVLNGVSLQVRGGHTVAVMGQSGSGKSVLARLLAAELAPSRGRILVAGTPLAPLDDGPSIARRFGVLFGANKSYDRHIDRSISVRDNLRIVLERASFDEAAVKARLRQWARDWDLADVLDMPAGRVDSITRHRLCLAQALVADPPLAIIDDPSWAVDIHHVDAEVALIRSWQNRTGGTLLLTTHSIMFAKALADQVAVMRAGEVIAHGPTGAVLGDITDDETFERRFRSRLSVRESDVVRLRALGTDNVRWGGTYLDIGRPMSPHSNQYRGRNKRPTRSGGRLGAPRTS
jgi:ABC-type multidrug transport system ATPase subunit